MESNLKQKTVSGMLWSAVQKFGNMGISFVTNIVLARMLTPDDYGCIGMLAIFITVSNTFVDGGFGSALIQKKRPTQEDYSTIFFWNIFLSVVLYTVLFFCAPLIADFYNISLLSKVLRVQGIILIINAFSIIQANQLRKQLKFKSIAKISLTSSLISVIIAIAMAYMGCGIWSLVAQQIVNSFVTSLFYWLCSVWRPLWIFSKKSFKDLFNFGSFILMSNLINTFCNNLNGLLIGKFFNPSSMGYFTQSKKLEDVFSTSIETVVAQVTYPVLVEVKDDLKKMKQSLFKFNTILLYIVTPLMLFLNLMAHPIINILFGEKWLPAAPFLEILAFQGIAICQQGVNYSAIASMGYSKSLFKSTVIKRSLSIILLFLGLLLGGVEGILWGMVISSFFICFYNSVLVQKYVDYSLKKQLLDLMPIILINIINFLIVYLIKDNTCSNLFYILIIYLLSYVFLSVLFKIEALRHIKGIIKGKIFK